MSITTQPHKDGSCRLACMAFALQSALICANGLAASEKQPEKHQAPVFIYDDGWFEEQGYRCWDVKTRWQAVPDDLKPHSWLTLYVAPECFYQKRDHSTGKTETFPPVSDPQYGRKHAALVAALDYCQQEGIGTMLMVRRYAKLRAAAPSFETVEALLERYPCVRALLFAELGSWQFSDVDQQHLRGFAGLAKRYDRKIIWTVFLARAETAALWNHLMADPDWLAFLRDHADVIVPIWKTVVHRENMLNWADCVGLWLSGTVKEWGFQFDGYYWVQHYARPRGSAWGIWRQVYCDRAAGSDAQFFNDLQVFAPVLMSTPSHLVKDTMILAALSGAKYLTTERIRPFSSFDGGGSLRSVTEKTQRLILTRRLSGQRDQVASLVKVAVVNPADAAELSDAGYLHSYPPETAPNRLWKTVFGIPDKGLDIVPNEGKHFVVPVVPADDAWHRAAWKPHLVAPAGVKDGSLKAALEEAFPRRFKADNPNVLVFDAGQFVYVTDSREENRTTLEFTLESTTDQEYRCTYLAQDATPVEVEPVTNELPGGWRKRFVIFAGCSALLEKNKP